MILDIYNLRYAMLLKKKGINVSLGFWRQHDD